MTGQSSSRGSPSLLMKTERQRQSRAGDQRNCAPCAEFTNKTTIAIIIGFHRITFEIALIVTIITLFKAENCFHTLINHSHPPIVNASIDGYFLYQFIPAC